MSRWPLWATLTAATVVASIGGADAQSGSATPFASAPTIPQTIPLIGGVPVPDTAPHLLIAIAANDALGAHALLAANTSPDEIDEYGRTALIYAVIFDNVAIGQMLISHGANFNLHDKLGKTAMHWAAERGSSDMLHLLLDTKAMVDAQDLHGLTPLMGAARNGHVEAVRLLLQYHADPRKNDYTGHDAIDWAGNHAAITKALNVAAAR
jgi:ankyrin repeat protein